MAEWLVTYSNCAPLLFLVHFLLEYDPCEFLPVGVASYSGDVHAQSGQRREEDNEAKRRQLDHAPERVITVPLVPAHKDSVQAANLAFHGVYSSQRKK